MTATAVATEFREDRYHIGAEPNRRLGSRRPHSDRESLDMVIGTNLDDRGSRLPPAQKSVHRNGSDVGIGDGVLNRRGQVGFPFAHARDEQLLRAVGMKVHVRWVDAYPVRPRFVTASDQPRDDENDCRCQPPSRVTIRCGHAVFSAYEGDGAPLGSAKK